MDAREVKTVKMNTREVSTVRINTREILTVNMNTREVSTVRINTREIPTVRISQEEVQTNTREILEDIGRSKRTRGCPGGHKGGSVGHKEVQTNEGRS